MSVQSKTFVQAFSKLFLKTTTEGAVRTGAGSLFQYFTTLIESDKRDKVRELYKNRSSVGRILVDTKTGRDEGALMKECVLYGGEVFATQLNLG